MALVNKTLGAITRKVSPAINDCELTHLGKEVIDYGKASREHEAYESCLRGLGIQLHSLPAENVFPDSVFVEDTAIVLDEIAVVTRLGVNSRLGEGIAVAKLLTQWRDLVTIQSPGTLDGGDVLVLGKKIYVGIGGRTNLAGLEQLKKGISPFGYSVEAISVSKCLHLKTAVTQVSADTLLINPQWVNSDFFKDFRLLAIDPRESFAGNALLVGTTVLYSNAFPYTCELLLKQNLEVKLVDLSELAKAESGVTCCSIVFRL